MREGEEAKADSDDDLVGAMTRTMARRSTDGSAVSGHSLFAVVPPPAAMASGRVSVEDHTIAFEQLLTKAKAGDPKAMLELVKAYQYGRGTAVNVEEARCWLYKGEASLKYASLRNYNALCYLKGWLGFEVDFDTAYEIYRAMAIYGDTMARLPLAALFRLMAMQVESMNPVRFIGLSEPPKVRFLKEAVQSHNVLIAKIGGREALLKLVQDHKISDDGLIGFNYVHDHVCRQFWPEISMFIDKELTSSSADEDDTICKQLSYEYFRQAADIDPDNQKTKGLIGAHLFLGYGVDRDQPQGYQWLCEAESEGDEGSTHFIERYRRFKDVTRERLDEMYMPADKPTVEKRFTRG